MDVSGRWRRALPGATCVVLVLVMLAPVPLNAQATTLRVEAERYSAFHDTTPGNSGGKCRTDDVDVREQDGGCTVGWWAAGEWLEFDVVVPTSGSYVVGLRSATGLTGNQVILSDGGQSVTLTLPNTGNAGTFTSFEGGSLTLGQGTRRLRLTGRGGSMDINYLTLRLTGPGSGPTATPLPPTATPPPPISGEAPLLPGPTEPTNEGPWFQLSCPTNHRLDDDPIVFPGRPGASHQHQFFGNESASAASTYESMVAADTTCVDAGDTAGYWIPTLYANGDTLVTPYRVRAYYYANAADRSALRSYPANLRIIAGDPRATGPQPAGVIQWLCRNRQDQSAGYPLQSANPPTCRRDQYLSLSIRFADCWDGKNLDSSDHRRHMAYADGAQRCPATHPVKLPKLRFSITYEGTGWLGGDFTLGAPRGNAKALPWYAMHADFWNTWQQSALDEYVSGCLRQGRTVRSSGCQQ